ncbi:5'/3'-nucleotidase SurE [Aspergillus stella-maris]|uniref:5'/3'-nucleotidase SurE n=1 Tax=Aspergillus stella-maris TaxID=1810926 RepID=UPI003CCD6680
MRSPLALALLPAVSQAINIVSSNDDGWAEINIRSLYSALSSAGHSVVVSAPAENQSGTGSSDETPSDRTEACEFDSCEANSGPYGSNATDPRLNWVNSYPVTSIKHGIDTLSSEFFSGTPDLAVSGPNVGNNLGVVVYFSGTVGAANYASATAGIPAIAFSGADGDPVAWDAEVPAYSTIYADLANKVVERVAEAGTPYLPENVWLNVNFPTVDGCASADDFSFVLSRIFTAVPLITADDVETCGSTRLPTESEVVGTDGCYVSISVGDADKTDADATAQGTVLEKLGDLLSCLP